MSNLNNEIIKKIKQIRIEKGLSQERLSELSKLDSKYINKLENGRFNLTIPTLENILLGLNIEVSDFFASLDIKENNSFDELKNTLNQLDINTRNEVSEKLNELIKIFVK